MPTALFASINNFGSVVNVGANANDIVPPRGSTQKAKVFETILGGYFYVQARTETV